jgi:hypothetical protein
VATVTRSHGSLRTARPDLGERIADAGVDDVGVDPPPSYPRRIVSLERTAADNRSEIESVHALRRSFLYGQEAVVNVQAERWRVSMRRGRG